MNDLLQPTLLAILALVLLAGLLIGWLIARVGFMRRERYIRRDAAMRSRAVTAGQFAEQLAPYLPDFPYRPTEAKFLGKPIDFIIFRGLDDRAVGEIVFIEVKSGDSRLSTTERGIREAIEAGRVRFEEYRIPQSLTKGRG
jgi:predicted Holliday junction resolvase-like endonuclease